MLNGASLTAYCTVEVDGGGSSVPRTLIDP